MQRQFGDRNFWHGISPARPTPVCLLGQQCHWSCTGLLAFENLPSEAAAEAAIAGALLLEHVPQAAAILLRPGALSALVDAAIDEAAAPSINTGKGAVLQDQALLH